MITLRKNKTEALTHTELDGNFEDLNSRVASLESWKPGVDADLGQVGFYLLASQFATFNAAVASVAEGEKATLIVDVVASLSANIVVPSNISLVFLYGGGIAASESRTFVTYGYLSSGPWLIFDATVDVSGAIKTDNPFAEWWPGSVVPGAVTFPVTSLLSSGGVSVDSATKKMILIYG